MGIFNFSKKKKQNTDFKTIIVDNIFFVKIPTDWNAYKSDRFRAQSKNK